MRGTLRKRLLLLMALVLVVAACTADDNGAAEEEPALPEDAGDEEVGVAEPQDEGEAEPAQATGDGVLQEVIDRGELNCGINDAVPGFGTIDEDGTPNGFDVDFCRAVAAAVLGDAEAVNFIPIAVADRFTSLQSGEIDVLIRNTTWTASRDGTEGAAFTTTTYYDGQGMMVRAGEFDSIDEMENTIICTLEGTTTELNLATRFAGIPYEPLTFGDADDLQEAFIAGSCDGWTSDLSQLSARRSTFPEGPEALVIFDEVFSKEPLGPAVRDGDSEWYDVVNWVVIATIQAEEFGITSENIGEFADTDDNDIRRFLGLEFAEEEGDDPTTFDPGLGLPVDFAAQVVEQVGNYGEIYDRNIGPDTPLGLERGVNALWTDGGLLYAPPYR